MSLVNNDLLHKYKKRGASSVLGPRFEGLRITLSVKPSNAENPTLMYVKRTSLDRRTQTTPSKGVLVALFFDGQFENCEVLKASKPKRSENAFHIYVCLPSPTRLWASAENIAKIQT